MNTRTARAGAEWIAQGDDPEGWASAILGIADEVERLTAVVGEIPARLLRTFEALTTIEVPEGWEAKFWDGPLGIALRRPADGYARVIMPGTDVSGRWYLGLHDEYNGHMGADAQDAVNWTVSHAPDMPPTEETD